MICPKCKKTDQQFYINRARKSGYCLMCKVCDNLRRKKYPLTRFGTKPKTYSTKEQYKYTSTDKGKKLRNEASRRAYVKHKHKWIARAKLRYAVERGKIVKPEMCLQYNPDPVIPCSGSLQAHHFLGYEGEHWKDVQWLCVTHHVKMHHGKLNQQTL